MARLMDRAAEARAFLGGTGESRFPEGWVPPLPGQGDRPPIPPPGAPVPPPAGIIPKGLPGEIGTGGGGSPAPEPSAPMPAALPEPNAPPPVQPVQPMVPGALPGMVRPGTRSARPFLGAQMAAPWQRRGPVDVGAGAPPVMGTPTGEPMDPRRQIEDELQLMGVMNTLRGK